MRGWLGQRWRPGDRLGDAGCESSSDISERSGEDCDDKDDDDRDGLIDGNDPGCTGIFDPSERDASLPCDDGLDNDGDGWKDWNDLGCTDGLDPSERDPSLSCDDGLDNDGDGLADYPDDPGCRYIRSRREDPACEDSIDNDNDGQIDTDDIGCLDASWGREDPGCQDGLDNDGDGRIDFDGGQWIYGTCLEGVCPPGVSDPDGDGLANPDPQCVNQPWNSEGSGYCGLGAELAPVLVGLYALARRRRGVSKRKAVSVSPPQPPRSTGDPQE